MVLVDICFLVVFYDVLAHADGFLLFFLVQIAPECHKSFYNLCIELSTLGTPQLFTWHRYESRRALKEWNKVIKNFKTQLQCSWCHLCLLEPMLYLFLILLDLVDCICRRFLFDTSRWVDHALDVAEHCPLYKLEPRCPLCLLVHLFSQFLKCKEGLIQYLHHVKLQEGLFIVFLKWSPVIVVHYFYAKDSICYWADEHVLHLIKFLYDCSLVEVLLDLIFSCNTLLNHRIHEILRQLPKCEEVVTWGYHMIDAHIFWSILFEKPLNSSLELLSDDLVYIQHLEHQFFDLLYSDHFESFIK